MIGLDAFAYAAAMSRVKRMPDGLARYQAWRAAKSARQLYLNRKRRETEEGARAYRERLNVSAKLRRERAANDPEYRARRNEQSR